MNDKDNANDIINDKNDNKGNNNDDDDDDINDRSIRQIFFLCVFIFNLFFFHLYHYK